MDNAILTIDLKHFQGSASDRRQSEEQCFAPRKMLAPVVETRMEQSSYFASCRIDARNIWPLVVVAVEAGKCQILKRGGAAVLFSNNVVHFMTGIDKLLRHLTVLTT